MFKLLLIDDNDEMLAANTAHLSAQGFDVTCANTGIKALACLNEGAFDCIVLDVLLPDLDGFAICKAARTITDAPILFLSCMDDTEDKVKGLLAGGDDYMTKPYSLKELTARIQAMLRRDRRNVAVQNGFSIDGENRILHVSGKNVLLSEKEFRLFMLFYENPGVVLTKERIAEHMWGAGADAGAVAVLVLKLRRKLEFVQDVIGQIESGYRAGYCLTTAGTAKQP